MNYIKLFGIAAFAIGAILYLAGADEHKVVIGKQNYDLGEYTKISVNAPVKLTVAVGEDFGLNVDGSEEELKGLKIYVKGLTLVIEQKRKHFNTKQLDKLSIDISLPKLKKFTDNSSADAKIKGIHGDIFSLHINGSGNVDFEGSSEELRAEINGSGTINGTAFDAKSSDFQINGSGDIKMAGTCDKLDLDISGSGDFMGQEFVCEKVEVDIMGSGHAEVAAKYKLDVDVSGSGDVKVYGDPKYIKNRSHKKTNMILK